MSHPESDILADTRWLNMGGIGRFAHEVLSRLENWRQLPIGGSPVSPLDPVKLWRTLSRESHGVFFSPGFNAPLRSTRPFVLTVHDLIHHDVPAESSPLKKLYYTSVLRPAVRRAFRVMTVSEYSRQRLAAWANIDAQRIVVAGNGVSECFTPNGSAHAPGYRYFLFVGNRKPHKNVPGLFDAFSQLPDDDDVRLVLSGESDKETEAFASRVAIKDRVEYAGHVNDAQLASLYRGAVALVIPSFVEGFGLPALEAMACGTPVIAADGTALPEVTGSAAMLVSPHDTEAIVQAMKRLLEDDALRATLGERGLKQAGLFCWNSVAGRVRTVLDEARSIMAT